MIWPDADSVTPRVMIPPSYDQNAPNAEGELSFDRFPDFEPQFSDLYIETETPTDFIYDGSAIGGKGFILSGRTKKIFESSGSPNIRFYPLSLRLYSEEIDLMEDAPALSADFWYMQIVRPYFEPWVDYRQSEFVAIDEKNKTRSPFQFRNKEELTEFIRGYHYPNCLDVTRLYLRPPSATDVAIFHLWPLPLRKAQHTFISAEIKEKLDAANISGYKVVPLTDSEIVVAS
jgi:hypothetical protein